jgi:tetratricopeptide (TPR) repeat protein
MSVKKCNPSAYAPLSTGMAVIDTAAHKVSSWNRQTYQRLKLALSLGLRRQIFIAVCDDLSLRNRLASKLHAELGGTSAKVLMDTQGEPKLVSLNLNLSDPNPLAQISQWLAQNRRSQDGTPVPGFQILGVELLTRQAPAAQRLFLRRLQAIERNLRHLESTLLIWLPRPWFHTIQQSVPEFWQWHTGLFEFEGEPTPLPPVGASKPEASHTSQAPETATGSFKEDLQTLLAGDLADTVYNPSLDELSRENQRPSNGSTPSLPTQGIPTDQNTTPSSPSTQYGNGIPYPTSNPSRTTPLTPTGNGISLDDDLRLGNTDQESPPAQSDEPAEELKSETTNLPSGNVYGEQPSNLQPSTEKPSPAEAYLELANYYRHAIEQGDASEENLAIAIQAYEQALQFLDNSSPELSDILNDLGNLYWMLSRCSTQTEHKLSYLEQGIQSYQLALTRLTAEEAPQTYAMVQNNLGAAYGDLARYKEPADSLEQSIRAYEETLRYRSADSDPIKYASTQNNLGTAYWHLAQHQSPVPNLRAAIAAYAEALSYYNTQSDPVNWAMIQNNLGTAYWNLAQYEQPETWLQLATVAYLDALKYRTPQTAPAACAATQNNLGTAYWHLADRFQDEPERRAENLHQCITAYEQAIALAQQLSRNTPPIAVNFDLVATRNNLGLAHYQLATEPQFSLTQASKSTHLEAALEQHIQACTGVPSQSDAYQTALNYVIKTIRAFYRESGISGQNLALSKVPGQLLPEILPRL